jgi:hypothetical protein
VVVLNFSINLPFAQAVAVLKTPATASSEACQSLEKLSQVNRRALRGEILIRLSELSSQCDVDKKKVKPWKFPCDPRAEMPSPIRNLADGKFRLLTAEEVFQSCVDATRDRCVWASTGTASAADMTWGETATFGAIGSIKLEKGYYLPVKYQLQCPGGAARDAAVRFDFIINAPSDRQVRQAVDSLKLPSPTPSVWLLRDNQVQVSYTLVNGYMWFSTDPAQFTTRIKRVELGNSWVQVSASPIGLGFTANGQTGWCNGPGDTLTPENITWWWQNKRIKPFYDPAPSGCSIRFTHTSPGFPDQPITATMTIRWRITWVGSAHTNGTLPDLDTTTPTTPFAITEAQTLITH